MAKNRRSDKGKKAVVTENSGKSKSLFQKQNVIILVAIVLLMVTAVKYFINGSANTRPVTDTTKSDSRIVEPKFTKEGVVSFVSATGKLIRKIDVEIAETQTEQIQGLMYRSSLADSVGMLFIFDRSERRYFWMKNTFIPLDIIYVDSNMKIVHIAKNTIPFSEESVPSYYPAQYVVEVNAGFCDKHDIEADDKIKIERDSPQN